MLARTYLAATGDPLLRAVACPILAFFGMGGDVGGAEDLALIAANAQRAPQVDTLLIPNANHVYSDQEHVVAEHLLRWVGQL